MSISFYKIIYKLLKYRRYDICVAGTEIWPTYIAALLSFIFDIKSISWVHTNLELIIQQYDKIKK